MVLTLYFMDLIIKIFFHGLNGYCLSIIIMMEMYLIFVHILFLNFILYFYPLLILLYYQLIQ
jgi:hypothetical protein